MPGNLKQEVDLSTLPTIDFANFGDGTGPVCQLPLPLNLIAFHPSPHPSFYTSRLEHQFLDLIYLAIAARIGCSRHRRAVLHCLSRRWLRILDQHRYSEGAGQWNVWLGTSITCPMIALSCLPFRPVPPVCSTASPYLPIPTALTCTHAVWTIC